ncbi:DUF1282 domain-containing protein [Lacihabitans sp. LS3-19]|uniref:hypothetical protein n=1 Tax=Lacihabitans sp. LS3-19 TaxID=2487335 RepID=UPI0020CBC9E1|nr:hypothetical protein [Lacihabitans sp. LS3-19]MCP9768399.1 DUF1282 domain-containing protein [Lacihabitans sp. LS3-19]
MNKNIYNPFNKIAGVQALGIGLTAIIIISIIAHFSGVTFPSIISAQTGTNAMSIPRLLVQNLGHWIIFSTIIYLFGVFASKSHIRAIDIFGTIAVSRIPFILFSFLGFLPIDGITQKISAAVKTNPADPNLLSDVPLSEISILIVFALLTLAIAVWVIALMYNAFRISSNIKGEKSAILFIVAIILSSIFSYFYEIMIVRLIP